MALSLDRNNFSRAVPRPFGAANWITLIRIVIAVTLLAVGIGSAGLGMAVGSGLRWLLVAGAVTALALDGVDGYLARRLRQTSAFGARFDLEADALAMLALAILVWGLGQAGPWVLAAGLMRYIFVMGSWAWPALAATLPPRRRRQTMCVGAMAALILGLAPLVAPPWSGVICLAGLMLLGYSFAADVIWLATRAGMEGKAAC